ncbi:MAG: helix-turn-helix transcriptional regulator [Oscillospiraceae bacterium]|nr:helix-turn-helix transcriptional regulator [Oscillospiraceae bacterium]
MTIQDAMKEKKMSIYRLAKASEVPYATVNDICNGKTRLEKCSAETIYRLAHALGISMEELLAPCMIKRPSFENFKSSVCHHVKEKGDIPFIIDTLEHQDIRTYYERKWYPESLYLLAMLDYLSRENNVPLCDEYDDLRRCKLESPVYPASVLAMSAAAKSDAPMKRAADTAISEFMRFNIVESEVRNVV